MKVIENKCIYFMDEAKVIKNMLTPHRIWKMFSSWRGEGCCVQGSTCIKSVSSDDSKMTNMPFESSPFPSLMQIYSLVHEQTPIAISLA